MIKRNDKYDIVEEGATGDYVFVGYGNTLNELFANCAEACFSAMTNIENVHPIKEFNLLIDGENIEELLVNFLAELIYLKDVEKLFFCNFDVEISGDEKSLKAVVAGETIDYDNHEIKTDVKAVTYHDMHITKNDYGFSTRVILDL